MNTFKLRVYEADGIFASGEAESIVIPTIDGEYGVMANHENLVVSIVPGMLKYRMKGDEDRIAAVSSGMMRVENNDVLIIVESAERPEDIDEERSREAEAEAKEEMLRKKSEEDYFLAESTLIRAINRLKVKNRGGS